jgi:hypothetical protein
MTDGMRLAAGNEMSKRNRRRWPHGMPNWLWGSVASALLVLLAGGLSLALGQLWLFPSLGATAYLLTVVPRARHARFYNIVVGHLIGLSMGLLAVWATGALRVPSVLAAETVSPPRLAAAVLAIALTIALGVLARAVHPPAAATSLLVALGAVPPTVHGALSIVAGVLIVATVGEGLRRLRLHAFRR